MKSISPGPKSPKIVNCLVEIPRGGSNKYEFDHELKVFVLDRVLYGSSFFPTEYGYIPSTKSNDNDPLDIMVITTYPTFSGCVLESRVIGALNMLDNNQSDCKIVAVAQKDPRLEKIKSLASLPCHFCQEVEDFWKNYARLQPNKEIKVKEWLNKEKAYKVIEEAISRFDHEK